MWSRPAASALSGNLLEMQILRPPSAAESETVGMDSAASAVEVQENRVGWGKRLEEERLDPGLEQGVE